MNVNPSQRRPARRAIARAAGATGCGTAIIGVLLLAGPAAAHGEAPDPMLRISVDNGETTTETGDSLDYTISVENLGATKVTGLRVSQTMPQGLTFGSADRGGEADSDIVVWSVDLKPTSTLTLHTTMKVGATPDEMLRMASVACASRSAKKAPIVCATHSDELPAGAQAAAESDAAADAAADQEESGAGTFIWIGAATALALAIGSAVVIRRRRRHERSVATTVTSAGRRARARSGHLSRRRA